MTTPAIDDAVLEALITRRWVLRQVAVAHELRLPDFHLGFELTCAGVALMTKLPDEKVRELTTQMMQQFVAGLQAAEQQAAAKAKHASDSADNVVPLTQEPKR
jgi:hypothetical protein